MKRYTVVDVVGSLLELRYVVINPQGKLVAGFKKGDADVYVGFCGFKSMLIKAKVKVQARVV